VALNSAPRIIFITGTDTGVGKTLLTALLLSHLRQQGCRALAMKPFCSGSEVGLTDVDILYRFQDHELATHEINPFFFPEPLAPLVAARRHRLRITLDDVLERIRAVINQRLVPIQNPKSKVQNSQNSVLLIEGAGGLLAPLGEGFNLLDLIAAIKDQGSSIQHPASSTQHPAPTIHTFIVARNQLGTINHTLLTVHALQRRFAQSPQLSFAVVLMNPSRSDPSTSSNPKILTELLAPIPVRSIPFLGKNPLAQNFFKTDLKKLANTLNRIIG